MESEPQRFLRRRRVAAADTKHRERMSSTESEQAAGKSDESRPSERPEGRASTIIVDPDLMAEAKRLSERPRAASDAPASAASTSEARSHGGPPAEEPAAPREPEGDHLSFEDAERFAARFRASWEPPSASTARSTPSAAPARAPSSKPPAAAAPSVLVSELPGAHRGRTLMLGGAAAAAFVAVVLLGWLASRSGVPDHPAAADPLAAHPAATAPEPEPPPPPVAPPAAEPAEPAEPPAEALEATAPASATEPEVTAAAEPEPVLVALQITTRPAGAQLLLDGAPVANPYDALHPKGGSHVVEASAPGYRAQNVTIELTKQQSVALELERAPAAADKAADDKAAPAPAKAAEPPRAKRPRPARPSKAEPKGAAFTTESPY